MKPGAGRADALAAIESIRRLWAAGQVADCQAAVKQLGDLRGDALAGACFGDSCLVLELARAAAALAGVSNDETKQRANRRAALLPWLADDACGDNFPPILRPLFHARRAIARAALDPTIDQRATLGEAIRGYETAWKFQPAICHEALPPLGEPAFLHPSAPELNAGFQDVLRALKDECDNAQSTPNTSAANTSAAQQPPLGWRRPALVLVGDTLRCLFTPGADPPPVEHVVDAWVLLVDAQYPKGRLALLSLRRVPRGAGALAPDPLGGGYALAGGQFQLGLQHAWLAVKLADPRPWNFDIRWRLRLFQHLGDNKPPLVDPIDGRSGEAAIACALRALAESDPARGVFETVDLRAAITATLARPGTRDGRLAGVDGVESKVEDNRHLPERLVEVLVFGARGARRPAATNGVEVVEVATLADAYENHLGKWPKITRQAREKIHAAAQAWLAQECGRYVLSELREEIPEDLARAKRPGKPLLTRDDLWRPLASVKTKRVVLGLLPPEANRVRLLAESGLGKSALLRHCEAAIADPKRPDPRVPLRVERLGAVDWRQQPRQVVENLAEHHLAHALGDLTPGDRQEWIWRQVRAGNVVFLLDAIDQTTDALEGLPLFLHSAEVARCPVLVTGREHTRQTKAAAYGDTAAASGTRWRTMAVWPFDAPRQREYLGDLADALILDKDKKTWNYTADDHRKATWQDLLGVPMLLRMLRDLLGDKARAGALLGEFNRRALCDKAVDQMIGKGLAALPESERAPLLRNRRQLKRLLGWLAFTMVQGGNFTGGVVDAAFEAVCDEKPAVLELAEALGQVNLTVLELPPGKNEIVGLSWRHLSFCEYFAGVHFAGLPADQQTALIQRVQHNPACGDANYSVEADNFHPDRWKWVFRFALSQAHAEAQNPERSESERAQAAAARDHLARALIAHGNPWVVCDAIEFDRLALPEELDPLCRWLVRQDWSGQRDFRTAWNAKWPRPELTPATLAIVAALFDPEYRDSRCLPAAVELLEYAPHALRPEAQAVLRRFHQEFDNIRRDPSHPGHAIARALVDSFRPCPAGAFWMGTPKGEKDRRTDEKRHRVALSAFSLASAPTTNAEFELFDRSHRRRRSWYSPDPDCPAVYVNWHMANLCCRWLGPGYALPTKAQWEYACRAGEKGSWCFGDDEARLGEYAWYEAKSGFRCQPVRRKRPNAWGLYDMHGNVWEWCADWYGEYPDGPTEDYVLSNGGTSRVLRGGSWDGFAGFARSADRLFDAPAYRLDFIGFRFTRTA